MEGEHFPAGLAETLKRVSTHGRHSAVKRRLHRSLTSQSVLQEPALRHQGLAMPADGTYTSTPLRASLQPLLRGQSVDLDIGFNETAEGIPACRNDEASYRLLESAYSCGDPGFWFE